MTNQKPTKIIQKSGINPLLAAATGVVIAAGGVIAGAIAMNDKKNRDAVNSKIDSVKDITNQYVTGIKKAVQNKKEELDTNISKFKAGTKEYMSDLSDTAQNKKNMLDKNIAKGKKKVKKSVDTLLS